MAATVALTPMILNKMAIGKVFKENKMHINSIDFDNSGQFCVTSSDDETLHIYNCERGSLVESSNSKKYGCNLVKFTHQKNCVLYASTKEDNALRYMSFYDNKFLRYFKGHTGLVVSLDMSPLDDQFISAGNDDTVRLWDLRMDNAQGKLHVPGGNPLVAFDPSGKVFAIALHSQVIRLYDVASYESGPFETGAPTRDLVMAGNSPTWTSIKFSADGKKILICTNSDELYIVNGFTVETREHILTGHENRAKVDLKADFTPDAQYVMCGSQNGNIHFWDVNTGKMVASHTGHLDPPRIVAFNPRYMMAATGDATLAFWTAQP